MVEAGRANQGNHARQLALRDAPAIKPALYGGVMPMSELASHGANAAERPNDTSMVNHEAGIRVLRTYVNVASVRVPCENAPVENMQTVGARFRAIYKRSKLSLRELAAAAGFNDASGVQRYVNPEHDIPLKIDVARRLAEAVHGLGDPPISRAEVLALTGISLPATNAIPVRMEGASEERMQNDLPVYGTALGAAKVVEGEAVEQTMLNQGEVIEYVKRPTILNGNARAYGLYVQGSSMYPVHQDGALILAERDRPLRVGEDVVVYLRHRNEEDDGDRARAVLVKRLVRRTGQYVELEQFSPPITFRIDMADVVKIDRVLTLSDLLG